MILSFIVGFIVACGICGFLRYQSSHHEVLMSIPELLDRTSICYLKILKIGGEELRQEYNTYKKAIDLLSKIHPNWSLGKFYDEFLEVNEEIWGYESALRQGQLQEYDTSELEKKTQQEILQLAGVGLSAVQIRNVNRKRKTLHNRLVSLTRTGYMDVKVNHGSEEVVV